MIGFVAAIGATFKGDVLVQLSKAPMGVLLVVLLIATATLVPEIDAEAGYIPGNVRGAVDKLMAATKADAFFTETAELVNGRAAVRAPRVVGRAARLCGARATTGSALTRTAPPSPLPLPPDDGHAGVPHHRHRLLSWSVCCCCGQRCKVCRRPLPQRGALKGRSSRGAGGGASHAPSAPRAAQPYATVSQSWCKALSSAHQFDERGAPPALRAWCWPFSLRSSSSRRS